MAEVKQCENYKSGVPKCVGKCMFCGTQVGFSVGGVVLVMLVLWFIYDAVMPDESVLSLSSLAVEQGTSKVVQERVESSEYSPWLLCRGAIMRAVKFPDSLAINVLSSPKMKVIKGGSYAVFIAFESKNDFGDLISQLARCDVINGRLIHFSTSDR